MAKTGGVDCMMNSYWESPDYTYTELFSRNHLILPNAQLEDASHPDFLSLLDLSLCGCRSCDLLTSCMRLFPLCEVMTLRSGLRLFTI